MPPFACRLPAAFAGRPVSLATRHGKERLLARPFRQGLDLRLVLAAGFDTDLLGTFSGERPRPADALETCRLKAEAGMDATGLDLGLASEGSFGSHPSLPWLTVGTEWLTFVDRREGLVIAESLVAPRTNFDGRRVSPQDDIQDWLDRVGFPSHALIARPHGRDGAGQPLIKGLRTPAALAEALDRCGRASADGSVWLETDMRAHCNPTRRGAIRSLAFRLVRRIARPCPACGAPGWGRCDVRVGLPCRWCGHPTERLLAEVWGCVACAHQEERPRQDGQLTADPGDCPRCNP
ncbi:DUF6671 family protein [Cyanobium gracile]|uniref:DUF6671 domain-containing protein n=1 Tax=Cyanobium gracile (strain ATCC 27147 / PCC 6307) TaxID=292564 RepID=K9P3Y7_CYAGP|nr:DUF6671 family protein [Cyanobium gracile]AFY28132.1 hypothetical protein Cyagr_0950 [Cyanobium gracile PCC 6307]